MNQVFYLVLKLLLAILKMLLKAVMGNGRWGTGNGEWEIKWKFFFRD